MFSLNISLTQSPLILINSFVDTHKPENKSVFCHLDINLHFRDFFFHYAVTFYHINLHFRVTFFHYAVTLYHINLHFYDFFFIMR